MLQVTPAATQAIQDHFKKNKRAPIRIFLKIGGCGMRSLGIAVEPIKVADQIFEIDGFTYAVNKNILRQFAPIKINSDRYTFNISGRGITPPIGCGTCLFGCGAHGGHRCDGDCPNCVKPCPVGLHLKNRAK